jgi:hypothetical protein
VEALLRSALLVLMDNGTAEYTFVTTFFAPEPDLPPADTPQFVSSHLFSPTALSAPLPADDGVSTPATDVDPVTPRARRPTDSVFSNESLRSAARLSKEDQTALNAIWKQIMDPALEHAKVGFPPFSRLHLCLSLMVLKTRADVRTSHIGAPAARDASPHDDPTHRGGHGRDTEARLPTVGNVRFWSPAADVAALSESDDGPNRGAEKGRGRCCWRKLFPPGHDDK